MSKLARLRSLWRNLRHRAEVDRDLDEELDSYADLLADEQRSTGADPEMARRAVRLRIGGMQQVKEAVRDSRSGAGLETVWHDVRFGARLLQRTPSFAVAVITSLALGIGANSAV